jgi:hypothetical protein
MPKPKSSLSFTLLTLFTSPERAGSIQGDLLEEAQIRGRGWFWSQVIRTTGALCWKGFARSPLAILGLTLSGGVAWFVMTLVMVAGATAVEFVSRSLGVPINIRFVSVFLLGTLLTGVILGRAAPVRGMYASVGLAFASVPVLALLFNFNTIPPAGLADFRLTALVLSEALLLLGSALSRRRAVHSR